jgi:glutamate racemase
MIKPTVCFIDSGIGGLSILEEVYGLNPGLDFIYCADKEYFPYGNLSEKVVIERVLSLAEKLEQKHHFDILVVACNTASTVVLPKLREMLEKPVVGVVPAIKPAAMRTATKEICLLATAATVSREYTKKLILDFAKGVKVELLGSNKLVELAEKKMLTNRCRLEEIEEILDPIKKNPNIDVVVLACTHFPFLKAEIAKILGDRINLIDSGKAIARRVESLLDDLGFHSRSKNQKSEIYITSTCPEDSHKGLSSVLQGFEKIEFFDLI